MEEPNDQTAENLAGEPKLVSFYLPLLHPMKIPSTNRLVLTRSEVVDWLTGVPWPKDFAHYATMFQDHNFVAFSWSHLPHIRTFDGAPMDKVVEIARFRSGNTKQRSPEGIDYGRVPYPNADVGITVIELFTVLIPSDQGCIQRSLLEAFDRCVEELNVVEVSYTQTSKDLRYRRTTRFNCYPCIPYVTLNPFSGTWNEIDFIWLNDGLNLIPIEQDELTPEQVEEVILRTILQKKGSPLIRYVEWSYAANRALENDADFATSLVNCHTAGEILFDSVLLMMVWEELNFLTNTNITPEVVAEWFIQRPSLESRIKALYHTRLSGWNSKEGSDITLRWFVQVGRIRNRVIHAGYLPSELEARSASQTLNDVEKFIKKSLGDDANRNRYPRTALMLLGIPGLERMNRYRGKIKRVAEDETEPDWLYSFGQFRTCLDDRLSQQG